MKGTERIEEKNCTLYPSIRLVCLATGQHTETPLCVPDPPLPPRCVPDPPCLCLFDKPKRLGCIVVSCTCDCVGDCACDLYIKPKPPCPCDPVHSCYCVSKGGLSPDGDLPPESCEVHARTFFRLASEEA